MTYSIDETILVAAPASTVWEVVTDFPRYGEWNPFVVGCASTLAVGSPIDMRVHVFQAFAQPQRETIFEHVPGERFCYGLPASALGALSSRRCHEVQAEDAATATYRSHFVLSGWLAPIVRALTGSRLKVGFHAMTTAIGQRAEHLYRDRRDSVASR